MDRGAVQPNSVVKFELIDLRRWFFIVWLGLGLLVGLGISLAIIYGPWVPWIDKYGFFFWIFVFSLVIAFVPVGIIYRFKLDRQKIILLEKNSCRKYKRKQVEGLGRDYFIAELENLADAHKNPQLVRSLRWCYVFFERDEKNKK